jgi:hypothetical protein
MYAKPANWCLDFCLKLATLSQVSNMCLHFDRIHVFNLSYPLSCLLYESNESHKSNDIVDFYVFGLLDDNLLKERQLFRTVVTLITGVLLLGTLRSLSTSSTQGLSSVFIVKSNTLSLCTINEMKSFMRTYFGVSI